MAKVICNHVDCNAGIPQVKVQEWNGRCPRHQVAGTVTQTKTEEMVSMKAVVKNPRMQGEAVVGFDVVAEIKGKTYQVYFGYGNKGLATAQVYNGTVTPRSEIQFINGLRKAGVDTMDVQKAISKLKPVCRNCKKALSRGAISFCKRHNLDALCYDCQGPKNKNATKNNASKASVKTEEPTQGSPASDMKAATDMIENHFANNASASEPVVETFSSVDELANKMKSEEPVVSVAPELAQDSFRGSESEEDPSLVSLSDEMVIALFDLDTEAFSPLAELKEEISERYYEIRATQNKAWKEKHDMTFEVTREKVERQIIQVDPDLCNVCWTQEATSTGQCLECQKTVDELNEKLHGPSRPGANVDHGYNNTEKTPNTPENVTEEGVIKADSTDNGCFDRESVIDSDIKPLQFAVTSPQSLGRCFDCGSTGIETNEDGLCENCE